MKISFARVAFSMFGMTLGVVPGLVLWMAIDHAVGFLIFNCLVGGFIGLALTWPGVSTKRVLAKTASTIIAHNTSDEWGEAAYKHLVEEGKKPAGPVVSPFGAEAPTAPATSPQPPPEPDARRDVGWYLGGGVGLLVAILGASTQCRQSMDSAPVGPKPMTNDQITNQLRMSQGLDPLVIHPRSTKEAGDPDSVEATLVSRIEQMKDEPTKDWRELERAEKSLVYWRERKRREAAGLSSHPPVEIKIPQSW